MVTPKCPECGSVIEKADLAKKDDLSEDLSLITLKMSDVEANSPSVKGVVCKECMSIIGTYSEPL